MDSELVGAFGGLASGQVLTALSPGAWGGELLAGALTLGRSCCVLKGEGSDGVTGRKTDH